VKITKSLCLGSALLVLAGAWFWWSLSRNDEKMDGEQPMKIVAGKRIEGKGDGNGVTSYRVTKVNVGGARSGRVSAQNKDTSEAPDKQVEKMLAKFSNEDQEKLRELSKEILNELKESFEKRDPKLIRRILARFKLPIAQGGLAGCVPKSLRAEAVASLGALGAPGAVDLIEYLGDPDPEIVDDAFAEFEMALDDWDLGDRARAEVLASVMQVLNDGERIDSLLMNLNSMRNSVKADTILQILETGTPAAKSTLTEQLEMYIEMDVTDAEGVRKWAALEENKDQPTDEEFYGPQKGD